LGIQRIRDHAVRAIPFKTLDAMLGTGHSYDIMAHSYQSAN
jgi:hypothetical protein